MSGFEQAKRAVVISVFAAIAVMALGSVPHAHAQAPRTDWHEAHKSKLRLVTGAMPQGNGIQLYAMIDVALAAKWKTYWRHPGDAGGIPPSIDLSASQNIASAEVLFPTPMRLVDQMGTTLGYSGQTGFPIRIAPRDPGKPVVLVASVFYGVCKEICIPTDVTLRLRFSPSDVTSMPPALARTLASVPRLVTLQHAKAGADGLTISDLRLEQAGGEFQLIVAVKSTSGDADVFVSSPDGVMVGVAKPAGQTDAGSFLFKVPVHHASRASLAGKGVQLVIANSDGRIETVWQLPSS